MSERNANILNIKVQFWRNNCPVGLTLLLSATMFGRLPDMTLCGWACKCHDGFALLIPTTWYFNDYIPVVCSIYFVSVAQ